MATLSPSDTAFEGFRITRERPETLLIWAVASFLLSLATVPLIIATGFGEASRLANESGDPSATLNALTKAGPMAVVLILTGLVIQSVFYSAVYRAVLRPEDKAYGYLRLGMDEVRQMALFLVLLVILMLAAFVIALLVGILAALAGGLLSAAGPAGAALGALVTLLSGLAVFGLLIYVAVRLSISLPMTFAERRLRILAAWKLSKGSFWRLFGAYALAVVLFIVVMLLAMMIFYGFVALIGAVQGLDLGTSMAQFEANLTSLKTYFTLPTLIGTAFGAVLTAVFYAVTIAPSAVAYQVLSGQKASVSET